MDTGALTEAVRSALAEALSLAFPVECAGCEAENVVLCATCRDSLIATPSRRTLDGGLEVCSGVAFEGVPARVLRAIKEDGRTGLARQLAGPLRAAAMMAGADCERQPVMFVPVPTSGAAFRRRGFRVIDLVARRAGLVLDPLLRPVRATSDQRGLDRDQRLRNVRGSMRARGAGGHRIIVLDDVVTTGATLEEASRALRHAGGEVIAAATIAATPRIRRS